LPKLACCGGEERSAGAGLPKRGAAERAVFGSARRVRASAGLPRRASAAVGPGAVRAFAWRAAGGGLRAVGAAAGAGAGRTLAIGGAGVLGTGSSVAAGATDGAGFRAGVAAGGRGRALPRSARAAREVVGFGDAVRSIGWVILSVIRAMEERAMGKRDGQA
jgi:hypothetical protein